MKPILGLTLAAAVFSCTAAFAVELKPAWKLEGLADPESVALSLDRTFFYVSNVNGEGDARDGNGFISRVSRDGKMIQREWATGLNAPKGLARSGRSLFVADIDRIVELDAASGRTIRVYPVDGAKFLNDVAEAPPGMLVSDSGTGRIHVLKDGTVSVWAEAPEFRAINGLLPEFGGVVPESGRLVVTTMAGLLLAVDWKTKKVTKLAEGLGDGDGVAPLTRGGYLVSEWPGRMFVVAADGTHRTIIDGRKDEVYLNDFLRVGDELIAPNWKPGTLTAYRIVE